jgi:hypothetical protein
LNKVFSYRNLNRKGVVWSIKDCKTNLVIDRVEKAYFKNVEFKVSEKGRQRVIRDKRKNVHAGVKGTRLKNSPRKVKSWIKVTYNPYKGSFFNIQGIPVHKAEYAKLDKNGCWLSGILY